MEVRLEVTGLQNFCLASPFLSLLGKKKKKKSIISKNTLFFNWPFREKKRVRGGRVQLGASFHVLYRCISNALCT